MANQVPSKRTYLIRRLIVLAALIAIIWAVVALIGAALGAIGGMFAKPNATNTSASNTSANGSQNYTTCMPKGLALLAVVGDGSKPQGSFAAGVNPKLWFTITNTSDKPCYLNVGTAVQNFTVTSGAEKIWSNSDCKSTTSNFRMLLSAGKSTPSTPIAWERVRSSSTGCDLASGQAKAIGGGASYHLQVKLGSLASNDVQFILN